MCDHEATGECVPVSALPHMKAPTALASVLEALAETWKEQITFAFVFKLDLFKNHRHKT